jgi:hypothetical protein
MQALHMAKRRAHHLHCGGTFGKGLIQGTIRQRRIACGRRKQRLVQIKR